MTRFITRRLALGAMAILGVLLILFILSRMSGDPRYLLISDVGYGVTQEQWDMLGKKLGLDKPSVIQFLFWLRDIFRGDFGDSIAAQQPVMKVVKERAGATLQLALASWLLGTSVGIPLGVFSALNRGKLLDYLARGFALLGQASPVFWVGIMLIYLFSVFLGLLPSGTRGEGIAIRNFILPAVTLGGLPAAAYLRYTRSAMLEVLDSEYIKFARAKGVSGLLVIWKHAFKNAILVPLTVSAFVLVGFLTGTVVAETVFSWPGIGRLAVQSLWENDFPVLSALVLLFGLLYLVVVLLLDILYAVLDPRIRYT